MLNSNFGLGGLKWNRTTLTNLGDNAFTANTTVSTFECFDIQFQKCNANYDYILKVANQVAYAWKINLKVYDSFNIVRLTNTTISFHDGTSSDQVIISNGNITQSEGTIYNLTGNVIMYIKIGNVQANATGTSYLYTYLKILVPNTSTYSLFIITVEIT